MPKAFPEEFRRDVVAVARRREAPISQIAKDFGISPDVNALRYSAAAMIPQQTASASETTAQ
jgi:hypothetical protein